jgi:hypothetical protein
VPRDPSKPLYEEPGVYIKIKENIYLVSFIELNLNKRDILRGGNNLVLLINTKLGFDVGRTFSLDKDQKPEGGMLMTHGEFTDEDIPESHGPTPYRV